MNIQNINTSKFEEKNFQYSGVLESKHSIRKPRLRACSELNNITCLNSSSDSPAKRVITNWSSCFSVYLDLIHRQLPTRWGSTILRGKTNVKIEGTIIAFATCYSKQDKNLVWGHNT